MNQAEFKAALAEGRKDFRGVDLHGVDLSGMDLPGVNMERADLSGANLQRACLEGSVIEHKSVTAEIAVMRFFLEVAAVFCHAVNKHCMVAPFPYSSAYHLRLRIYKFPIIAYVSRTVSHCMRILAKENRLSMNIVFNSCLEAFY